MIAQRLGIRSSLRQVRLRRRELGREVGQRQFALFGLDVKFALLHRQFAQLLLERFDLDTPRFGLSLRSRQLLRQVGQRLFLLFRRGIHLVLLRGQCADLGFQFTDTHIGALQCVFAALEQGADGSDGSHGTRAPVGQLRFAVCIGSNGSFVRRGCNGCVVRFTIFGQIGVQLLTQRLERRFQVSLAALHACEVALQALQPGLDIGHAEALVFQFSGKSLPGSVILGKLGLQARQLCVRIQQCAVLAAHQVGHSSCGGRQLFPTALLHDGLRTIHRFACGFHTLYDRLCNDCLCNRIVAVGVRIE